MNRRLAGFGLVASAAVVVLATTPARADAPQQQGWWTQTNPGVSGAPGPAPPDVPSDGLLVQGGAGGTPTAFAGLVYQIEGGATVGQLTLKVASTSAGQSDALPQSTLELCPLVNPTLRAEQGGPMSDAPDYDCKRKVTGKPDGSGAAYTFSASGLASDGSLAVAVLPGDATTRVVLAKPDTSSLEVEPGISSSTPFDNSAVPGAAGGSGGAAAASGTPTSGGQGGGVSLPAQPSQSSPATDSGQAPVVARTPSSASGGSATGSFNPTPVTATAAGGQHATPRTVALLLAGLLVGGGLWLFAGRSAEADGEADAA